MRRYHCLEQLASWTDDQMLVATSLSSNTSIWSNLRLSGPNFFGLNMGLCLPFAIGLSLAFPRSKVLALDSDGSMMVDASALITLADVHPENLVAIVMDNGSYARMGPTATSRRADLEKMAQGAGVQLTATIRTEQEFEQVREAFEKPGPHFFLVKIEAETQRVPANGRRTYGPAMREVFVDAVMNHPDYRAWRGPGVKASSARIK